MHTQRNEEIRDQREVRKRIESGQQGTESREAEIRMSDKKIGEGKKKNGRGKKKMGEGEQ